MDAVEEIKGKLDVDEVVGSYIQLKPAGSNLKGLCPFHHEKTSSFMVSPDKGIWRCFGCGEGGDIFTFVEKMEGLDFRGALENLAQRAGVVLDNSAHGKSNAKLKERLYQTLELATKYYEAVLTRQPAAQAYLNQRGFKSKTIQAFRLGYAPAGDDELVKALRQRKVHDEDLLKAGLARQRGGRLTDMFHNRLMVPLADGQGRSIGFTGRVLDDSLPKYLNTPQTLLFDKSRFLYGLHLAKEAIRKNDEAVLVEGNLDVIASWQAGIEQVVASSGTALTPPQLKMLSRLTQTVKIAFDQDDAGLVATERSIPLAQAAGISLYMVSLGKAKDPDELIKTSPDAWPAAIKGAAYVMDWLLKALQSQYDLGTAPGKKRFSDRVIAVLGRLNDPVEQDHYTKALAKLIAVEPAAISRKLAGSSPNSTPRLTAEAVYKIDKPLHNENTATEEALLSLVVVFPDTRVSLQDLGPTYFTNKTRQEIFKFLRAQSEAVIGKTIPNELKSYENYVKILTLQGEELYKDWAALDRRIEAFSLASRLQTLFIKRAQKLLATELKVAETAGDNTRKAELLKQFRDLSRKL